MAVNALLVEARNKAIHRMSAIVEILVNMEHKEWSSAWSTFLLNVRMVKEMDTPVDAPAILSAGELWQGEGWTTGRASKTLYQVAGVPLVSPEVKDYKGAFLYAPELH